MPIATSTSPTAPSFVEKYGASRGEDSSTEQESGPCSLCCIVTVTLVVALVAAAGVLIACLCGCFEKRGPTEGQLGEVFQIEHGSLKGLLKLQAAGVLGVALTNGQVDNNVEDVLVSTEIKFTPDGEKSVGEGPSGTTVIMDPAGYNFISNNDMPGAGRASQAIYAWLGYPGFPDGVRKKVDAIGKAAYAQYDVPIPQDTANTKPVDTAANVKTIERHVIHTVGGDYSGKTGYPDDLTFPNDCDNIKPLEEAYKNSLFEFGDERAKKLNLFRMLPVSSGVFAGGCGTKMPYMQARALIHVLQDKDVKEAVDGRELVLCFYDQKAGTQELLAYKKAMENDGQEPAETQTTGTDPAAPTDGAPAPTEGTGVATADGATAPSEVTTLPGCTGCTEAANTVVDAMLGKGPEDAADAGVIGA